jgi:two-component system chemotaxis response regulator CheB
MIRVLIAEDSPTARALIASILATDPEMVIVGEAEDGMQAIRLAALRRPDVIVMDIRMPHVDGFEATKRIMADTPTPVVIVTATAAPDDLQVSLNALRAGALTVLAKPAGPAAPDFEDTCRRFVRTVKSMASVKVVRRWLDRTSSIPASAPGSKAVRSAARAKVVAIAASTGGPAALHRILSELPQRFPLPILVVQHMSPGFTEGLVRWLGANCPLTVRIPADGEPLSAGHVYVAPSDVHLGVTARPAIALSAADSIHGFRPSATHLFDSVAKAFRAEAIAVMLTGMGEDGVEGLRSIRRAGGMIIAQDETTSVIFGMPGAAIAAGLADLVLPLDDISGHLSPAR